MRVMRMEKLALVPACRPGESHSFIGLGEEDSGEVVSRCGNCLALRYELEGKVRYEVARGNSGNEDKERPASGR